MQIIQFTPCVDAVGEGKQNQFPADLPGSRKHFGLTKEVRMQRRRVKIPAQNMEFAPGFSSIYLTLLIERNTWNRFGLGC